MRKLSLGIAAIAALLLAGGASPVFAQADAAPAAPAAPKKGKGKAAAKPAASAAAATPAPAGAAAAAVAPAAAPAADAKPAKGKKGRKGKGAKAEAPAPAPPAVAPRAAPSATTVIIKQPAPAPAAAPLAPPEAAPAAGPVDDDLPTIAHTAITKAMRNKPLVFTARMQDPSGIFQPVLYLRKRGTGDFIPIKMIGSKVSQGDYAVEADAKLISVDLEYYIECWDNAGNGPARAGSPDSPFAIKLESPPAPVVVIKQGEKAPVEEKKPPGAPPAISHSTVSKATKGQSVEIAAKLVGDTGVSHAKVFFRKVGEKEFKELPMGDIGGDNYTATMPASMVTVDLEYYLEAFDRHGNGPGRSGGPQVPYTITVTEKAPDAPTVVINRAPEDKGSAAPPPPPPPARPRLVKVPFKANPGRWVAWLAMGGFVASSIFAGGEAYGAWQADSVYQHTFQYEGRLDDGLHQRSLDYSRRTKIFGIAAAASLVVGITLLLIFPEYPETQLVTGSGGDLTLARF